MPENFERYNLEKAQDEAARMKDRIERPSFGKPENYTEAESIIEYENKILEILGNEFKDLEIPSTMTLNMTVSITSRDGNERVYWLELFGLKDEADKLLDFYKKPLDDDDKKIGDSLGLKKSCTKRGDLYADQIYRLGIRSRKLENDFFEEFSKEEKINILKTLGGVIGNDKNISHKISTTALAVEAYELLSQIEKPGQHDIDLYYNHYWTKYMNSFSWCFSSEKDRIEYEKKFKDIYMIIGDYIEKNIYNEEVWNTTRKLAADLCLSFLKDMTDDIKKIYEESKKEKS
jgi:hypothetical protein